MLCGQRHLHAIIRHPSPDHWSSVLTPPARFCTLAAQPPLFVMPLGKHPEQSPRRSLRTSVHYSVEQSLQRRWSEFYRVTSSLNNSMLGRQTTSPGLHHHGETVRDSRDTVHRWSYVQSLLRNSLIKRGIIWSSVCFQ